MWTVHSLMRDCQHNKGIRNGIISSALVVTLVTLTDKTKVVSQVVVTFVTLPDKTGLVAQDVAQ